MPNPYEVPLAALDRRRDRTATYGPDEPTGAVPAPVPAPVRPAEGPLDPALPINALGTVSVGV